MAPLQVPFTSFTFTLLFLFSVLLHLVQGTLKAESDPIITPNSTSATNYTLTFYNDPSDSIDNDQLQVTFVFSASYLLEQEQVYINFLGSLVVLSPYQYFGHLHQILVPTRTGTNVAGSFYSEDTLHPRLTPRACVFAVWKATTYFVERPGLLHPFVATIKDGETVLGEWTLGARTRTIVSSSSMPVSSMVPSVRTTTELGKAISVPQASMTAAASRDIISSRNIGSSAVDNSMSVGFLSAGLGAYEWHIVGLTKGMTPLSVLLTFIQTLVQILPYGRQRVVSGLTVRSVFDGTEIKFFKLAVLQFERDAAIAAIVRMLNFAFQIHRWIEMDGLLGYRGNLLLKVTLRRRGDAK
ncbi:MAG: hypothetical protein Q9214_002525 [Letrouitia sp. 1 TL-2023]